MLSVEGGSFPRARGRSTVKSTSGSPSRAMVGAAVGMMFGGCGVVALAKAQSWLEAE